MLFFTDTKFMWNVLYVSVIFFYADVINSDKKNNNGNSSNIVIT